MKKLFLFILIPFFSFAQVIIDQVVAEGGPYNVGDIITLHYVVDTQGLDVNYLWFRYNYSNKHLELVPESTVFKQGTSTQTSYYHWNNYTYNYNPQIGVGDLYGQYRNGMGYSQNQDWNVAQISIQRTDGPIAGIIASQQYKIKDNTGFQQIHKLHVAYGTTRDGQAIPDIGSRVLWLDLNSVTRLVSSVKFKVAYPAGYDITKHTIQIMETNEQGVVDWTTNPQPVAVGPLDSSGEFLTDKVKKNKKYQVMVNPAWGQNVPSNIITVTDAYKAFKALTDRGINNTDAQFQTLLESRIANVTQDQNFDSQDAYYLFATVMGVDLSNVSGLLLPTTDMTKPTKFLSGFTEGFSSQNGPTYITPVEDAEVYNLSFAWAGDLDFSHSSPITTTSSVAAKTIESSTSISSTLKDGKVIVEVSFQDKNLSGAEYKIGYDDSKLELENILFDTGNTMANFSTHKENVVTFGSMDKKGTDKIKAGIPYKLIFKTKTTLSNTSGLIYTYFAEGVDNDANKVNLKIK